MFVLDSLVMQLVNVNDAHILINHLIKTSV